MKAKLAISSLLLLSGLQISGQVSAADYLLTAKQVDDKCELFLWNPAILDTRHISRLEECPNRLFVSEPHASFFYVDGREIVRVSLQGIFRSEVVAETPGLTLEEVAADVFSRPLSDYEKMTASEVMPVRNLGISDDGVLWMHVGLVMAGDDDYDFLYRLVDREWVFEEFVHCARFELCEFSTLAEERRGNSSKEIAPELWHDRITENPYFNRDGRASEVDTGYRDLMIVDRYFIVDDEEILLNVWVGTGPDSGYPYLGGAVVQYDSGESVVICEAQCSATLYERFLLAQRYWGGTLELYDVATGDSVLGALKHAIWLRIPATDQ